MSEKGMLIVSTELIKKIDDNRGDLTQAEFIDFLIDSQLKDEAKEPKGIIKAEVESIKRDIKKLLLKEGVKETQYATKEEVQAFQQDTKKLLKSFLDYFVGYGLELGKQAEPSSELAEITSKLQGIEENVAPEPEGGEVKIKWK